jgi:hypothetical protein
VILTGLSCLVALACVGASARRLAQVVALTSLHPAVLLDALRGDAPLTVCAQLRAAIGVDGHFAWEQDLLAAFAIPEARVRDALVNEKLTELDGRAQRWARMPRVCASVATSAAFLLASIALVQGLAPSEDDAPLGTRAAVVAAVNALAIGIAAASFCYAVHVRARSLVKERMAAVDRLVLLLESAAGARGLFGAARIV